MLQRSGITVFFPAYNDEKTIVSLVEDAFSILPILTDDFEVLVINDGSTDNTAALLDDLANKLRHFRVIHHNRNQGYGAALRTGFKNARKELIFYTDGDGQYDVKELPLLHSLLTNEIDIINGYKKNRADKLHRVFIGKAYGFFARYLFQLPIRDVDCDFRIIRRRSLESINLESSSGSICVELIRKLAANGCIFKETPVSHFPRLHGNSQFFTFNRVSQTAIDFAKLWLRLVILDR